MSTYDELIGTAAWIADAAIEWEMRDIGWWKGDDGWYSDMTVNAGISYRLDFTGMYITDLYHNERYRTDEFALTSQSDFRGLWRGWYEAVFDTFRPWQGLPDHAAFEPSIETLRGVAQAINVNTEVTANGAGPGDLEGGNAGLDADLVSVCGEIIAMNGVTMDVFALNYSNRLPSVFRGQLAIVAILGSCLTGEQNLWAKAREDIAQIADDVLEVMRDRNSGGAASSLKIVGAVLAGASLFVTGGTSAAVVLGNTRTIVGVLSAFVPSDEAPTPAQETYGGDSAAEVLEKLQTHLNTVNETLQAEETVVRDSLTGALREVVANGQSFDLSVRPALLEVPDADVLAPSDIDVKPNTLVLIGSILIPDIAATLEGARNDATGAPDRSSWQRNDTIGLGSVGPYEDWRALHEQFVARASGTVVTLRDVGDKLVDVAAVYVDVDEVNAELLRRLDGASVD